jgi:hypothetical protein
MKDRIVLRTYDEELLVKKMFNLSEYDKEIYKKIEQKKEVQTMYMEFFKQQELKQKNKEKLAREFSIYYDNEY